MVYALFGLPRKKAAGCSYRPAVLGKLFFCDQVLVDEFVSAERSNVYQVSYSYTLITFFTGSVSDNGPHFWQRSVAFSEQQKQV